MKFPVKGELYRHYKGNLYRVLSVSVHTESNEYLVNYTNALKREDKIWSRPLAVWSEAVEFKGDLVSRFRPVTSMAEYRRISLMME